MYELDSSDFVGLCDEVYMATLPGSGIQILFISTRISDALTIHVGMSIGDIIAYQKAGCLRRHIVFQQLLTIVDVFREMMNG